jgi:RNA polymerase sigma-70 factor (ECF subfamily)
VEPASDPHSAYRRYGPALVRKAERILRSRDDATDVVHALFVDLIQRRVGAIDLPYLYRAVTNRCLNLLRDSATRARLLAANPVAPVARVRCDDQVIGGELFVRLIERLDAGQREVLIGRFVDDLTQDEIADHLGLSRKTVGKRLAVIRRELIALTGAAPPPGDRPAPDEEVAS